MPSLEEEVEALEHKPRRLWPRGVVGDHNGQPIRLATARVVVSVVNVPSETGAIKCP